MKLRAGIYQLAFPRPTLVMGIVNVTPDSFSDGGQFFDATAAIAHGRELARQGADLIDVGGESTRPNAGPVSVEEEIRRVVPVIGSLAAELSVPISVDTNKPAVARAALAAGATIVNDVCANRSAPEMWEVAAAAGAGYVCMHMQGDPPNMQTNPTYQDVVREVAEFFQDRLERLTAAGLESDQIVLDIGIGFGKTVEHNLKLLGGLRHFGKFERPLMCGISRKSFLGSLLGVEVAARLPASLAGACWAVCAGAHIVRTHDVAPTVQALRLTEALQGESN